MMLVAAPTASAVARNATVAGHFAGRRGVLAAAGTRQKDDAIRPVFVWFGGAWFGGTLTSCASDQNDSRNDHESADGNPENRRHLLTSSVVDDERDVGPKP
jgi:hypothetical protein